MGKQLGVAFVLEGSVRKTGNRLRITAQLINVADGYHLWSETYDREMTNLLAIQTEVSQQVVKALRVTLGVDDARALTKLATGNPEAHRLYLLGRFHFGKGNWVGYTNAQRSFEEAIKLDPNNALAYCGLADNYGFFRWKYDPGTRGLGAPKGIGGKGAGARSDPRGGAFFFGAGAHRHVRLAGWGAGNQAGLGAQP